MGKIICGLLVWGAALYGVLHAGLLADFGLPVHGICGPWGCGPPVSALVAWHGFWILLALPPLGLIGCHWSSQQIRMTGIVLTGLGLLGVASVVVWQAVNWLPTIPAGQPTYFVRRCLFSIVTLIDVPLLPVVLSGLVLCIAARMKSTAVSAGSIHAPTASDSGCGTVS